MWDLAFGFSCFSLGIVSCLLYFNIKEELEERRERKIREQEQMLRRLLKELEPKLRRNLL